MNIAGREIGPGQPPYIIAEVSCNHCGELAYALELIYAAKECGADAVKFQAYTADTITIDCSRPEFTVQDGPWKGRNLYQLYEKTQTPFKWFPRIAAEAEKLGITWFASAIKIASFEIVDIPLIKYAAATGLPLIISTGMASADEKIAAHKAAAPNYIFLNCTSGYPSPVGEAGLSQMHGCGISDHSIGPEIPIAATALGATIIEKHFRLSWHPVTEDTPFSLDEVEFYEMTKHVRNTWAAMQPAEANSEASQRPLRRSLFAVADIAKGETFTSANVRSIRPGHGLPPADIGKVIGKTAAREIARGEPMAWAMVSI
jgi:sialic acid synthase SpsE